MKLRGNSRNRVYQDGVRKYFQRCEWISSIIFVIAHIAINYYTFPAHVIGLTDRSDGGGIFENFGHFFGLMLMSFLYILISWPPIRIVSRVKIYILESVKHAVIRETHTIPNSMSLWAASFPLRYTCVRLGSDCKDYCIQNEKSSRPQSHKTRRKYFSWNRISRRFRIHFENSNCMLSAATTR